MAVSQTDHFAEVAIGDEFHGGNAKARRKNAVKWRGRAAALNVAQHTDTNILLRTRGDRLADQIADGAVWRRFSFNSGGSLMPSATTTMVKCLPSRSAAQM